MTIWMFVLTLVAVVIITAVKGGVRRSSIKSGKLACLGHEVDGWD